MIYLSLFFLNCTFVNAVVNGGDVVLFFVLSTVSLLKVMTFFLNDRASQIGDASIVRRMPNLEVCSLRQVLLKVNL